MENYFEKFKTLILHFTPKVLTALVILIVGLLLISLIIKAAKKVMLKRGVDETLSKFLSNLLSWTLKILLFIAIASKLGIETTSFAALIGAAGLAVGLALQGSLSNFAGGALIMIFKPFQVGDLIEAQGEIGVVKEIQIFTTKIISPTNKLIIIPNGALSNGNITNYTAEGKLRVDLTIGVSYEANIKETKNVFLEVLNSNPKVLKNPAPSVNVANLGESSVDFAIRPFCKPEHYWDVYFGVTESCKLALDNAGIEIPYPHSVEIQKAV